MKLDETIRIALNGTMEVAFLTDPRGTRIELTGKLALVGNRAAASHSMHGTNLNQAGERITAQPLA